MARPVLEYTPQSSKTIKPDGACEIKPTTVIASELVEDSRFKKLQLSEDRIERINQFFAGDYRGETTAFLKHANFSAAEKHIIISDPRFIQLYDAQLFDAFFGERELSKQELSLISLLGNRMGLNKQLTVRSKNTTMNIRVGKK